MRRVTIPRIFRILFSLALALMVLLGVLSLFSQQPSPEVSLQQTVDAGVRARSTELALLTGTPDATQIQATVNALVDATMTAANAPTVTPTPVPSAVEQVGSSAVGIIGWLWSVVLALWNLFAFGGVWMQVCCCIVVPGIILLAVLREGTFG
jgi:hypothetical protein